MSLRSSKELTTPRTRARPNGRASTECRINDSEQSHGKLRPGALAAAGAINVLPLVVPCICGFRGLRHAYSCGYSNETGLDDHRSNRKTEAGIHPV